MRYRWNLTLRFLTDEAVPALAALLVIPLPGQMEVVVVGQNGAEGFVGSSGEPLVLLTVETQTLSHRRIQEEFCRSFTDS